ncbi:UVI-1 [Xylaria sp. CBS 124048]|nr:UVI-1 [Xylaria sp. CBS 124048]
MLFAKIFSVGAVMASAASALGSVQIVAEIDILTQKSKALYASAQSITASNAALISVGQGPLAKINIGLGDIISSCASTSKEIEGSPAISVEADAKLVIAAFQEFTEAQKGLLNILTVKAGLLAHDSSVGLSVSANLRAVEHVVDDLSLHLVGIVEINTSDIQLKANVLGEVLSVCIDKFDAVAV